MAKQLINIGTSANDGLGDSLRVGAEKINSNFNELYNSIAYTLPTASTSVKGGVIVDGTTLRVVDGIISATVSDSATRLVSGNATVTIEDDGDVTSRLVASGPVILLAGGDGGANLNSNYTQLQWSSDLNNPDLVKSQYLWLDTDGIHLQTTLPGLYSNTLHYDNNGILTFNDSGKIGGVQSPSGIDLYATSDMQWTQLNYDNKNFVWVTGESANIDVVSSNSQTVYSWGFTNTGELNLPGSINITAGNIVFDNDYGIMFADGSTLNSATSFNLPNTLILESAQARNFFVELYDPLTGYNDPATIQVQAQNITSVAALGAVGQVLKFMGTGQTLTDAKKIIIAPDDANGWSLSLGGITENQTGFIPPAPTYISESYITDMYGQNITVPGTAQIGTVRATTVFRPPVLTTSERDLQVSQNGDMIYNSTTNRFQGFQDGAWVDLAPTTVDGGPA